MNFDFHEGIKMVKKIKMRVELNGGDIVTVPEWVKTEGDLEKFADEYANRNISIGYKLGIYNSFAVINDFIDQNLNEDVPHYTVLLRDDIKSEEFTIDDFKKWTESREHGLV